MFDLDAAAVLALGEAMVRHLMGYVHGSCVDDGSESTAYAGTDMAEVGGDGPSLTVEKG